MKETEFKSRTEATDELLNSIQNDLRQANRQIYVCHPNVDDNKDIGLIAAIFETRGSMEFYQSTKENAAFDFGIALVEPDKGDAYFSCLIMDHSDGSFNPVGGFGEPPSSELRDLSDQKHEETWQAVKEIGLYIIDRNIKHLSMDKDLFHPNSTASLCEEEL